MGNKNYRCFETVHPSLAVVCCTFMCADDILHQYVNSTIQYDTIQYNTILSKGVFSISVLLRKTSYYYCVICILFWSILMFKFGVRWRLIKTQPIFFRLKTVDIAPGICILSED